MDTTIKHLKISTESVEINQNPEELFYKRVEIEGKIYLCSRTAWGYWAIGPEVKE